MTHVKPWRGEAVKRIQKDGEEVQRDELEAETERNIRREIPSEKAACSLAAEEFVCEEAAVCVFGEQQNANWDTFHRMKEVAFERDSYYVCILLVTFFLPLYESCRSTSQLLKCCFLQCER